MENLNKNNVKYIVIIAAAYGLLYIKINIVYSLFILFGLGILANYLSLKGPDVPQIIFSLKIPGKNSVKRRITLKIPLVIIRAFFYLSGFCWILGFIIDFFYRDIGPILTFSILTVIINIILDKAEKNVYE